MLNKGVISTFGKSIYYNVGPQYRIFAFISTCTYKRMYYKWSVNGNVKQNVLSYFQTPHSVFEIDLFELMFTYIGVCKNVCTFICKFAIYSKAGLSFDTHPNWTNALNTYINLKIMHGHDMSLFYSWCFICANYSRKMSTPLDLSWHVKI